MDAKLAEKVDAYCKANMPWWDRDEQAAPAADFSAMQMYTWLSDYFGEDLDRELEKELAIECYKDVLKADATFFDCADTGYCPDTMVENWGDVYLGIGWRLKEISSDAKNLEDDAYYLADCTVEPTRFYKVDRPN